MFRHPRGQQRRCFEPVGSCCESKRSQRQHPPSQRFLFGGSIGKQISLSIVLLICSGQVHFIKQTLQIALNQYDDSLTGSYQYHNTTSETTTTRAMRVTGQISRNGTLLDGGSNKTVKDILKSDTKLHNFIFQDQQPQNQTKHLRQKSLESNPITNKSGKFAYAFILGGAMSAKSGTDYRGGLYGAVVAAHGLRLQGSKADIVLMVQISATTKATRLPKLVESFLREMNIRILYLPKYSHPELESFYSLMLEKFRVLQLEEYSRVLYLDSDILPLCNLDYMMELSEQGKILQDNVVLTYHTEPASGGFFVLKPNVSDYGKLTEIIDQTENKYFVEREYPHWDPVEGWGHIIDKEDPWKTTKGKEGTEWTFYGAQADQGLLYYWTKYFKKSVSIVREETVEQWGEESGTNNLQLLRSDDDALKEYVCTDKFGINRRGWKLTPMRNFKHFTGPQKPWLQNLTRMEDSLRQKQNQTTFKHYSPTEYWFWLLHDLLRKTGFQDKISLDFITPEENDSSLGNMPTFSSRYHYLTNKFKRGWKLYEHEEVKASLG